MFWLISRASDCPSMGVQTVGILEGEFSPVSICQKWWDDNIVNGPMMSDIPPVGPVPQVRVNSLDAQGRVILGKMIFVSDPYNVDYDKRLRRRIAALAKQYGLDAKASLDEVFIVMLTREHGYKFVAYTSLDLMEAVRPD